jgi:hypothetical protein
MSSQPVTKTYDYILYFGSFITSQALSMWGQYFTLKFKNLTNWEALKMALPFAWIDWIFLTFAIDLGHTKKLVTPTQDTFLLIISQFTLVNIINFFYLKQNIYFSDFIAFFLIILAYSISFFNLVSKAFNIPIPKKVNEREDSDEENAGEIKPKESEPIKTEIEDKIEE